MQKTILATISAVAALTFSASAQNQSANSYTASNHVQVGTTATGNSTIAKKANTWRIFTLNGKEASSPHNDGDLNQRFGLLTRTYLTKSSNTDTYNPLVAFIGGTEDTTFQWGFSEHDKKNYFPLLTLSPAALSLHSTTNNQLKAYFPRILNEPILFQGDLELTGSIGALGNDNILPNQTLTGSESIITRALGDIRYALKTEIPNLSTPWAALNLSLTSDPLDSLTPTAGQIIYHNNTFLGYDGSQWQTLGSTSATFDISPSFITPDQVHLTSTGSIAITANTGEGDSSLFLSSGNNLQITTQHEMDIISHGYVNIHAPENISLSSSESRIKVYPALLQLSASGKVEISGTELHNIQSGETKIQSNEVNIFAQTTTISGTIRIEPQGDLSMGPFTAE